MKILSKKECTEVVGSNLQNGACIVCYYDSDVAYTFFSFLNSKDSFQKKQFDCQNQACKEEKIDFWVFKASDNGISRIENGDCAIGFAPITPNQITSNDGFIFLSSNSGK